MACVAGVDVSSGRLCEVLSGYTSAVIHFCHIHRRTIRFTHPEIAGCQTDHSVLVHTVNAQRFVKGVHGVYEIVVSHIDGTYIGNCTGVVWVEPVGDFKKRQSAIQLAPSNKACRQVGVGVVEQRIDVDGGQECRLRLSDTVVSQMLFAQFNVYDIREILFGQSLLARRGGRITNLFVVIDEKTSCIPIS